MHAERKSEVGPDERCLGACSHDRLTITSLYKSFFLQSGAYTRCRSRPRCPRALRTCHMVGVNASSFVSRIDDAPVRLGKSGLKVSRIILYA